jgi:hypothetical protein
LETEKRIGFKLPQEYVDLLASQNGGYIRWSLQDTVHDVIRGIGPYFPALEAGSWESYGDWLPFDLKEGRYLVPFDGDGHWSLCLDYRRDSRRPGVTIVDTEGVRENQVANTFGHYLRMLKPSIDEDVFVLLNVENVETLKGRLGSRLEMEMDKPSDWANGYLEHRLKNEAGDSPKYVWLSLNLTPRGFVRFDDPRYDELKDALPGTARRFPGLADEAIILTASAVIIRDLLSVLTEVGVKFAPLNAARAFGRAGRGFFWK